LFGVFSASQGRLDQGFGRWSDLFGPIQEPFRTPLLPLLMIEGHVLLAGSVSPGNVAAWVDGNGIFLAFVVDLHHVFGGANPDFFVDQPVGDAVEVFVVLHMVVNAHPGDLGLGKLIRPFWQRIERRMVDRLK